MAETRPDPMQSGPIQHTVAFRLHPEVDESAFLGQCRKLEAIPGVDRFEILDQVGGKTDLTHALSMYFDDEATYEAYNGHPDHVDFVERVWKRDVADFQELDYRRRA